MHHNVYTYLYKYLPLYTNENYKQYHNAKNRTDPNHIDFEVNMA